MNIDLSKVDKIVVREATMNKIVEWYGALTRPVPDYLPDEYEFPTYEAVVEFDWQGIKNNQLYFNLRDNDGIFLSHYVQGMNILQWHAKPDGAMIVADDFYRNPVFKAMAEKHQDNMRFFTSLAGAVLAYIMIYENEQQHVTKQTRRMVDKIKKPRHGEKKGRTVYISKKTYVLREKVASELPKRTYERHAEAWPVRGFWRTSKLGNRHWVPGFWKGDESKRPTDPTTYKL